MQAAARSIDGFSSSRREQGFTDPLVIFLLENLIHKHINVLKRVQLLDMLLPAQLVLQDYDFSKNGEEKTKTGNTENETKQKNTVTEHYALWPAHCKTLAE